MSEPKKDVPAPEPQTGEPLICKFCHLPIRNEDGGWYSVAGEHAHVSCGAKTKPWRELYDKISPERRERIEARVVEELAEIDSVPATAVLSKPAREWLIKHEGGNWKVEYTIHEVRAIVDDVFAFHAQQSAAKEVEIADAEGGESAARRDAMEWQVRAEAAERERDSLRAERDGMLRELGRNAANVTDAVEVARLVMLEVTTSRRELAALKAGKDGQQ